MPANQTDGPANWSPKPDFNRNLGLTHCDVEPQTVEDVVNWLDDASAVPEAEVYRELDVSVMRDILEETAEKLYLDVRSGYYTVQESLYRHQSRQLGRQTIFAVRIAEDNSREVLEPNSRSLSLVAS